MIATSPTFHATIAYAGWVLLLLIAIAVQRVLTSAVGGKPANSFRTDGSDVSPLHHRLCRAHANCYESFPFTGGLMLASLAVGATAITDTLAPWMVAARIAQSTVHLSSGSERAAKLRFLFLAVQMAIAAIWIVRFLMS